MEKKNAIVEFFGDDLKRTALFVVLAGISLAISFFFGKDLPVDPAWVAIILCGTPILYEAVTGLILRHDIKADVLVAVAIVASLILQEWFAAGEVAFIMELGGLLEDISADRSRAGIERLISMVPSKARLIIDGKETEVDAESVRVGQIIRILPGDTVPLDGKVVLGHSYVDQSSLTGESVPVAKEEGSEVFSGTVNQLGTFDMEVTCTAQDSSFQRLVDMVESTDAERTRVVKVADKWATYLVALVFVIAAATYLLTQEVSRALTVMIVFCPCAFILATPTAVVAAIGNLSKHGILVRDGDALEKMAHTDRLVFDKTGTLTEGKPYVMSVTPSEGFTEEQLLRYAGTVEKSSEHPYAGAILARCGDMPLGEAEGVEVTVGRGISATVDGRLVKVGNPAFTGISIPSSSGETVICVTADSVPVGFISVSDRMRDGVSETISDIRANGTECVMLTGDSPEAAARVAEQAGISEYTAECRPEDKVARIVALKEDGHVVCMIGDGINDAPSLKAADVGIAMGGTGSGITVGVADMVIVGDEVGKVPRLQFLTKKMLGRIKINIAFGMSWNAMAVALAVTGTVGAVMGAIIHNVGSVAVVVSSFLLLFVGTK